MYLFPVEESAGVTAFEVKAEGRTIKTKVEGIKHSLDSPATLKVGIMAVMKNKIAALESPSHKLLNGEM